MTKNAIRDALNRKRENAKLRLTLFIELCEEHAIPVHALKVDSWHMCYLYNADLQHRPKKLIKLLELLSDDEPMATNDNSIIYKSSSAYSFEVYPRKK